MELTDEQREQAIKSFRDKIANFPSEPERKDTVFNNLNSILQAIGSYLNDDKLEFKRETTGDKEYLIYSSVYGTAKQDVTADSVKAFLEDALTLLFNNCRELNGSFNAIKNKLEDK